MKWGTPEEALRICRTLEQIGTWAELSEEDRTLLELDELLYGHSFVMRTRQGVVRRVDPALVRLGVDDV